MRASGWGGRLALLVFGFLLAALILEVWLQSLAWWIGSADFRPRGRARFAGDAHRVLCIGDSNTYGYEVAAGEAYPAQLERLWNERGRRPRIEVVNLARVFQHRCPGEVCDLLQADGHPTAAGHRVVAETRVAQRAISRRP